MFLRLCEKKKKEKREGWREEGSGRGNKNDRSFYHKHLI